MNYEQKHDEFFTRLQRLIETSEKKGHIIVRIEDLKSTFPELAESEDEKHRNWILEYLYDGLRKADEQFKPQFEAAIAWLEKQSESKTDCPQNHQDVNHPNGCIVKADFNGGEGFYKVNLDYLNKKQVEEIEEMIRVWNKEISNNGNIKHCVSMCLTDADEQRFKDYGTNLKDCLAWLEKQGEQPTDKVESKFKVGDWITDGYIHCKITEVLDDRYIIKSKYCYRSAILFEYENRYHLWTIDDAKDGDVLVAKDGRLFIFTGEFDAQDDNPIAYCGINSVDKFIISNGSHWTFKDGIKPATKEQRDLLFQKMKEAEYEWDDEKKELRKIEDKMLDADKVIEWLKPYGCVVDNIVEQFKKDFGL